jgi:8-oxo-dGTP pyrophosphatase MutT (NUDIX family)
VTEVPPSGTPRLVALCVLRRGNEVLVLRGFDPTRAGEYYVPVGGGVEYGELSRDAVRRAVREQLGIELGDARLLGILENIFTYAGSLCHEVCFIHEAEALDPAFYARPAPVALQPDGRRLQTEWRPLMAFGNGQSPLYPTGLLHLLT